MAISVHVFRNLKNISRRRFKLIFVCGNHRVYQGRRVWSEDYLLPGLGQHTEHAKTENPIGSAAYKFYFDRLKMSKIFANVLTYT